MAQQFDVVSRGIDVLQSLTNVRLTIALGPPNRPPDAVEAVEYAGMVGFELATSFRSKARDA